MKLKELRKQYPGIKATSVKVFMEKLNDIPVYHTGIEEKHLGDHVKDIIESVVPKVLLDALGEDCGCKNRQEALNHFHEDMQYNNKKMLTAIQLAYHQVMGSKITNPFSQCHGCHKKHIKQLRQRMQMLISQKKHELNN